MVANLISNILNKPQAADVPDELPPLMEDSNVPSPKANVPDKLPELQKKPEAATEGKERSVIEREIEMIHKEFEEAAPDAQANIQTQQILDQIQPSAASQNSAMPQQAQAPAIQPKTQTKDMQFSMPSMAMKLADEERKPGFFSDLARIIKEQGYNESLLSQDMFDRMKRYAQTKDNNIGMLFSVDEKSLQNNLLGMLDELNQLETKWQVQKAVLEEDRKFLQQREEEIKRKIEEIKRLSKEIKFHQNVPPERQFILKNKIAIKNIREMVEILKVIDDTTFAHHVNESKNDFAEWIRYSVRDVRLAEKIAPIRNREKMIEGIELEVKSETEDPRPVSYFFDVDNGAVPIASVPARSKVSISLTPDYRKQIDPSNYFKLVNGDTIKNIHELASELRKIDDSIFSYHVNQERNDFASWVRHVFADEKLADYLMPIKNRKEMIDFLDVFL